MRVCARLCPRVFVVADLCVCVRARACVHVEGVVALLLATGPCARGAVHTTYGPRCCAAAVIAAPSVHAVSVCVVGVWHHWRV